MPRTRYRIHEENYAYFFTSTVVAWLPVFAQPWTVEIIYNSWRFLQQQRSIIIFGYVIMENHLHWIAAGPEIGEQVGREFIGIHGRRAADRIFRDGFAHGYGAGGKGGIANAAGDGTLRPD